ncbi:MAG TPA: hypothetical protein VGM14_01415 [Streptosporangiaceae bacterium]
MEPQGPNQQPANNSGIMFGRDGEITGTVAFGNARITQQGETDSMKLARLERLLRRLEAGLLDQFDIEEVKEVLQQEVAVLQRSQD